MMIQKNFFLKKTESPINLKKYLDERDWWTIWYFIFSGKSVEQIFNDLESQ